MRAYQKPLQLKGEKASAKSQISSITASKHFLHKGGENAFKKSIFIYIFECFQLQEAQKKRAEALFFMM